MKIVLDNNILFSVLNPHSVNSYLFSELTAQFYAPVWLQQELEKHKKECIIKSGLSEYEFHLRLEEIYQHISFEKVDIFSKKAKRISQSIDDEGDLPYLLVAVNHKATIWSNDPHLKSQSLVPVLTTRDIVEKLIGGDM